MSLYMPAPGRNPVHTFTNLRIFCLKIKSYLCRIALSRKARDAQQIYSDYG